ncbi:MAG: protease family protein [Solirubrobacteraceae bacterium]|jgi:membrane protease YdiL (CAAX protease family)|nr:protease family protein [Solirubrobacteraceae bacterium]
MELAPQVALPAVPPRPWSPVLAPLALVASFGCALLGGIVVAVIGALAGASFAHPPPGITLTATVLQDAAFVLSAVFFASQVARPRPEQFGLRRPAVGLLRALGALGLGYAVFIAFSGAWTAALNVHDKQKLVEELGTNDNAVALVAVCLLTCVIAPICEEFFFRGFFFTSLRNWCGVWPAAVITGLVFGAIHVGSAPAAYLIPLAFFGFVLCIVYWKTGSLYPCIALHALNNSIALGLTEHWRWQIPILTVSALAVIGLGLRSVARLTPAG